MVKFIISLIEQKNIKIKTNKLTLKLFLISSISNYPNVKLILNQIMTNQLVNNLMNEINNLKDEKKNLSVIFENKFKQLNEKIELKKIKIIL